MFPALRIKLGVKIFFIGAIFCAAVFFVNQKQAAKNCENIVINIDNQYNHYFLNEDDVLGLLTQQGEQHVIGTQLASLDIKALESQVVEHPYVRNAEVYVDLKGNMTVKAYQSRPIVRMLLGGRAKDVYLSAEGSILPFSERYTARVPLVSGPYAKKLAQHIAEGNEEADPYLELFKTLDSDPFWKVQIAYIELDKRGEVVLHPQVSKQLVEFGKPENIELKLRKLKIFYKKILPFKGWNEYYRVNLKYRNQIVCE